MDGATVTIEDAEIVLGETQHGFEYALAAMKKGYRAQRAGWNGKGMWVCMGEGQHIPAERFWNKHTRAFAHQLNDIGVAEVLPYFIMKTADDKILMGWLASQSDLAADDWIILED
jgi:hypothetical protein